MKKIKNIIILAAGESTRFWPLTEKNSFKFIGQPLFLLQIKRIEPYVEKIYLVVNQENEEIFKRWLPEKKRISLIRQKGEGQASALLSAKDKVRGETVVMNNVDIYNPKVIFKEFLKKRKRYPVILTAKKMKEYFPGGYFTVEDDKVIKLTEKPKPDRRPSNLVRLVVDYFANFEKFLSVLKKVPRPFRDGAFEEGLNQYFKRTKVTYINYKDYFYFLKYPWHVLTVKDFFLQDVKSDIGKNVSVASTAKIEGAVHLEDNVIVHEFAKIVGPCFIGRNSVVGNYAMVIRSMIGEGSIVGGYCEATRSYLGDNVMLHRNYVGDSVLDKNVMLGAGAVLANFRFDEEEVKSLVKGKLISTKLQKFGAVVGQSSKIGVNASLMPGVKIGQNRLIQPNQMVKRDLL